MSESRARPGTTVELATGWWRTRLPTPFPGLPSINIYLAREPDGSVTLIEAGMDVPDAWEMLSAALASIGADVAAVGRIVPTHAHIDHWGLVPRLVAASGAELVMPAGYEVEAWGHSEIDVVTAHMREVFVHGGAPAADVEAMVATFGRGGKSFADGLPVPDRVVSDGDTLTVGGRAMQVVSVPGHANGHLNLRDPETNALFSGDHVLPGISPHIGWNGKVDDPLGNYLRSLAKVAMLDPSLVLPAHGGVIESPVRRIETLARHHRKRLDSMAHLVTAHPRTAHEVMGRVFRPNLLHFEQRLALAETLAHLEALRMSGRARRDADADGAWWYAAE